VRVFILAAQPLVRAGLRHTIEACDGVTIVGESESVAEAVALALDARADIVLVDPDSTDVGLNAVGILAREVAGRILVVTAHTDTHLAACAIEAGASGVISKDQSVALLQRALTRVHGGEIWLDREKTAGVLRHVMRRNADPDAEKIGALTKREREVIRLVGEGLKNGAIAERLFISDATVRNHLTSILGKLELSDRFELAVYAYRHGLANTNATVAGAPATSGH